MTICTIVSAVTTSRIIISVLVSSKPFYRIYRKSTVPEEERRHNLHYRQLNWHYRIRFNRTPTLFYPILPYPPYPITLPEQERYHNLHYCQYRNCTIYTIVSITLYLLSPLAALPEEEWRDDLDYRQCRNGWSNRQPAQGEVLLDLDWHLEVFYFYFCSS